MADKIARIEVAEGADEEHVTELVDYTIRGYDPNNTPFDVKEVEEDVYEVCWRSRGEEET